MALTDLTVKIESATYDLAIHAGQFIVDLVATQKDGFQPLKDTIAIGAAAVADLLPAVTEFSQLAPEAKEDLAAFLQSWLQAGLVTYGKLVAK